MQSKDRRLDRRLVSFDRDSEEKLLKLLSDTELKLFKAFSDAQGKLSSASITDGFVGGFCLGMRITIEVMEKQY